ncbi:hypothetical protein [Jannaschia rubra]|uniref:hypothetical protein n=1 Tax=Jannaschia rubra TaxID=282197 RepID=UPI0008EEC5BC|nr:hypothetical protein [Jannaschia rubra]SFG83954.1 hypothetical protein SAMN04488517_1229 [Jannaschia rubra]
MKYTLGEAAKATGKAKSTILRAIKNGTVSASKGPKGSYQIDPAELHRVFEPNDAQNVLKNVTQPLIERAEHQGGTADLHLKHTREELDREKYERERERDQMQATIDDLRARLDRSEDRVTALLAAPEQKRRSWWPWGRS